MTQRPTEPIRREHRELTPHLQHLDTAAGRLGGFDAGQAGRLLPQLLSFLRDQLLPHARAEEEVLYPAIDGLFGAPVTATMVLDHIGIAERIDRLGTAVDRALDDWDDAGAVAEVSRQLVAISAIVALHFRKEEEVLLPILDDRLSIEEGQALFDSMGHGIPEHAHG